MRKNLTGKEAISIFGLLFLIVVASGCIGWYLGYYRMLWGQKSSSELKSADLTAALSIIKDEFDGEWNETNAIRGGIAGLVSSLGDSHSYYLLKDEYQKLSGEIEGEFVGLGIIYSVEKEHVLVTAVLPDSPAEDVGLIVGDRITKIDETVVSSLPHRAAVREAFKGAEGEETELIVLRDGVSKPLKLTRRTFQIKNMTVDIKDGVGIVRIYQFSHAGESEFNAIKQTLTDAGVKQVVLDLRGNVGGSVGRGAYVADQFISEGVLVSEKRKSDKNKIVMRAKSGDPLENVKVVVLVNQNTASEAEVLAAALQENGRATLIGQKTLGKGTQQQFFTLSDGSAIDLTVGKWFTPQGHWVDGVGITPEIIINTEFTNGEDQYLKKARELLNQ